MPDAQPSRTLEQRLAVYNALAVTVAAVLATIAWFPSFFGKEEELSALALLRDNPAGVLVVRDLGEAGGGLHRYDVGYTLLLKNSANHAFDVGWSLDQLFIGTPGAGDTAPLVVNDPPTIWDANAPGMLTWRQAIYDLSTDDTVHKDLLDFLARQDKHVTAPGGGLTGPYKSGHVSAHNAHYIVTAHPQDFVNVTITYGMDSPPTWWHRLVGGSSTYDENLAGETVRLGDAVQPGCPLGVAVANSQLRAACGIPVL